MEYAQSIAIEHTFSTRSTRNGMSFKSSSSFSSENHEDIGIPLSSYRTVFNYLIRIENPIKKLKGKITRSRNLLTSDKEILMFPNFLVSIREC